MNAIAPAFGCAAGGISFEAALDRVLRLAPSKLASETVTLSDCVGRIIAAPAMAGADLPRFDQSAMDGYAVRCGDLTPGVSLLVAGRTAAGEAPCHLNLSGVHQILTGAPLPQGADAVIAQEDVHRHGDHIEIARLPTPGINVRQLGEDIRAGQLLIPEGTRLDWRHIAVLAAQGVETVSVRRRPRITLLSSGRELRAAGKTLAPGEIHDSNLPMLLALLTANGSMVRPMAIVADDPEAMRSALRTAAEDSDLVITTAGISVGDEDHVKDALRDLGGYLAVLTVAMKPGKPLAAGRLGDAVFIGLPGNPQAALAGAIAFLRPLLARMAGTEEPVPLRAHAAFAIRRKPGRTEFIPVSLHQQDACLWAERTGPDGSGRFAPLLEAFGLAVLSAQEADIRRGSILDVIPFNPSAVTGGIA
jgi:molybdopterin molybdotransferase